MSNQTLLQVPTDVGDAETLKRFLDRLVERLDIILGYRGDAAYATEEQLTALQSQTEEQTQTLAVAAEEAKVVFEQQIQQLVDELSTQLDRLEDLVARVDQLELDVSDIHLALVSVDSRLDVLEASLSYSATVLRDFNDVLWSTGPIYSNFTALGSDIANAPTALGVDETPITINPSTTYNVYVEVRPAYLQRVTIYGSDFQLERVRVGSTWAELVSNAWI